MITPTDYANLRENYIARKYSTLWEGSHEGNNLPGLFQITDYGADTDASGAENAVALQAAVDDAAEAGGGCIWIPSQEFQIGAQINLPQDSGDTFLHPIMFAGNGFASCLTKTFSGNMFSGVGATGLRVRHWMWENLRLRAYPNAGYTGYLVYFNTADMLRFTNVVFDGRSVDGVTPVTGAIDGVDTWDMTLVNCQFWGLGSSSVPVVKARGSANNSNEWKFFGCRWERSALFNSVAFHSIGDGATDNHSMIFLGCKFHGAPGSTAFTSSALIWDRTNWSQLVHSTEMYHNAHGAYVVDLVNADKCVVAWNYTYNQASQISAGMVRVSGDDNIIGPNFHTGNAFSVAEVTNTGLNNLKMSTAAL